MKRNVYVLLVAILSAFLVFGVGCGGEEDNQEQVGDGDGDAVADGDGDAAADGDGDAAADGDGEPDCTVENQETDCASGEICDDGVCVDDPGVEQCTVEDQETDCASGEICDDGVCVDDPDADECTVEDQETDCASGEICDDGECVDDPAAAQIELTFVFIELSDPTAEVGDLTVDIDGDTATTTGDAGATLTVTAGANIMATMTGTDFLEHHIYLRAPAEDSTQVYTVGNNTTLLGIADSLGTTVDDTKALVSLGVRDASDGSNIADMTITADSTSEMTLVFDSEAGLGFSLGDTTLANSNSTAILVNVDPGDLTPSFDQADDDYNCVGESPIAVEADTFVISAYGCEMTAD